MIQIIKLKSGIELILDKMDSVKSVSIGIFCKNGSANEREDEFGISHFIEHMLFKGTKNRNAYQIVEEMESIGAEINAFTSREKTCFYAKCIDENLFKAADVLVDMIENPLFDNEELEREKLVVLEEIKMNEDDPDSVAIDKFDEIVFDNSTLSHQVLGYKENILSFNHDKLSKYYFDHYTKDKIFVSISGSFNESKVIKYFEDKFENLNDRARIDDYGETSNRIESVEIIKDVEQAHIVMGCRTVPATHKFRFHLSLLSILFGGGMSSRLFQSVREKKGLPYSVYSSNSFYKNIGEFGIMAGVSKDRVDEYIDAIKEELQLLDGEKISKDEFDRALTQIKSSYIYALESTSSRMKTNGSSYIQRGECLDENKLINILNSITLDEIEEAKKIITDFDKYTIVTVIGKWY